MRTSSLKLGAIAAALFIGLSAPFVAAASDGLVAHYRLDGDARDSSGNAFHGQILGPAPAADRFGVTNQALWFDGIRDFINCGSPEAFAFETNFTLTAWVKADGLQSAKYIVARYFMPPPRPRSYGLGTEFGSSQAYGFVAGDTPYTDLNGGDPLNDGDWHALALTYDNDFGVRLFKDGLLVGSAPAPGLPPFTSAAPLTIGGLTDGANFGGWIDDVKIFSRALSSQEILSAFAAEAAGPFRIQNEPADAWIELGTTATFGVFAVGPGSATATYQWYEGGVPVPGATNQTYMTGVRSQEGEWQVQVKLRSGDLEVTSRPASLRVSSPSALKLVAHWNFDENFGGTVIDSAGSADGSATNVVRVAGRVGPGAAEFGGTNSHIFVGAAPVLLLTNTHYSISWWQNWRGSTAHHQNVLAFEDGADYSGGYQIYLEQGTPVLNHIHASGFKSTPYYTGPYHPAWQSIAQAKTLWQHFTLTWDGARRSLYADGVLVGTRETTSPIVQDGDDVFVIGALRTQDGRIVNHFNGQLDDLRIYHRALGADEVTRLYEAAFLPVIVTQPVSTEVQSGGTAQFQVAAQSASPLSFQWFLNGAALAGATNSTLTITNTQAANEGTYSVHVVNQNGGLTSAGAVLHVRTPTAGGAVQFSNQTTGVNAPISDAYGARLSGPGYLVQLYAGGSLETLAPVGPAVPFGSGDSAGYFADGLRVVPGVASGESAVLNLRVWEAAAGPTYEAAAANRGAYGLSELLTVTLGATNAPVELTGLRSFALFGRPRIDAQPRGISTIDRTRVVLEVAASGTGPLGYQWFKSGAAVDGASASSLVLSNTVVADTGIYTVVITNAFGSITSAPANVVIRELDREAPVVTVTSPENGLITDLDRITISGKITDNVGVTSATWEHQTIGGYLELSNGTFSITIGLRRGANTLRIRASDADGNQTTAEVTVTLEASREIFIAPIPSVPEGSRVKVPILVRSKGEISGITLNLNYTANYLTEPQFEWAEKSPGALSTINTNLSGQVRATLALGGATLPAGTNPLATVTFRVRSIPNNTVTPLGLQVPGVYAITGEPITTGTDVKGGSVQLLRRRYTADNNANDQLDVGDASIMLRMISLLEPPRPWDIPANDLNRNSQLDAGDVILVLRAVVNLDPQPGATAQAFSRQSVSTLPNNVLLTADKTRVNAGDKVRARVEIAGRSAPLSGASFMLRFPTNALRVEASDALQVGPIVPAGSLSLWNIEPHQTNLETQTGVIHFGVSNGSPWPNNNGSFAEFTFTVKDGALDLGRVPISLGQVQLTDGWQLEPNAGTELVLTTRDPVAPTVSSASRLADGSFQITGVAEPGLRYDVEISNDLVTWTSAGFAATEQGNFSFTDSSAQGETRRFYRLKQVD